MVRQTTFLTYDRFCSPVLRANRRPSRRIPEWTHNVWPGFDQYCGDCHNTNVSSNPPALAALGYTDEADAFQKLKARHYANTKLGALGSPAFWAARGERADGRDNTLAKYQPDYVNGDWGFHYSELHAHHQDPALCDGTQPAAARWVYRFGQWIDNHMPRNTGANYDYQFDRFHPAVDAAVIDRACSGAMLRVGYWDDRGFVESLDLLVNDQSIALFDDLRNGAQTIALPEVTGTDGVKVIAIDGAGNRQIYERSVKQLIKECRAAQDGPIAVPVRKKLTVRRVGPAT